jgi:hypothetical protein
MKKTLLILIVILLGGFSLQAKDKHYNAGKVYIDSAGFVYVSSGDTMSLEGKIITVRHLDPLKRGMLAFAPTADWKSSDIESYFVNGYVRSHKSGAFIFPIGQGSYRPARISGASDANPTDAAYYTPSLFDISPSALSDSLKAVTNECWIIQGSEPARITLSWDTDLSSFGHGELDSIVVAGWNGTEWVLIPSAVDPTEIIFGTGAASTIYKGTVTTTSLLSPNSYEAYTLGTRQYCVEQPTLTLATTDTTVCGTATITIDDNSFGGSATAITSISKDAVGDGSLTYPSAASTPFVIEYVPASTDTGKTITITVTTNNPASSPCEEAVEILEIHILPIVQLATYDVEECLGTIVNLYDYIIAPTAAISFDETGRFTPIGDPEHFEIVGPDVILVVATKMGSCPSYSTFLIEPLPKPKIKKKK